MPHRYDFNGLRNVEADSKWLRTAHQNQEWPPIWGNAVLVRGYLHVVGPVMVIGGLFLCLLPYLNIGDPSAVTHSNSTRSGRPVTGAEAYVLMLVLLAMASSFYFFWADYLTTPMQGDQRLLSSRGFWKLRKEFLSKGFVMKTTDTFREVWTCAGVLVGRVEEEKGGVMSAHRAELRISADLPPDDQWMLARSLLFYRTKVGH